MWRDATGCIELGCARSDSEADVQVANGASVVDRIATLRQVVACKPQEKECSLTNEIAVAYGVLNNLLDELVETCEESETEYREEIDRQNLRQLMDDIDLVERVKLLIEQILERTD